jgi:malic enzyme
LLLFCALCFGLTFFALVQDTVEALCEGCESPLIFPLSNPTTNAEITIEQAVEWSKGKCIFAAGSPFETQTYEGRTVYASQCNNMFIFPGVGMGTKLSAATTITDNMLLAASKAVADFVPEAEVNHKILKKPETLKNPKNSKPCKPCKPQTLKILRPLKPLTLKPLKV